MFRSLSLLAWAFCALVAPNAGCARATPSPAAAPELQQATLASAEADDCTLQTPLVPGVPGSPGNLLPSELRPEGVSELAALMRAMMADLSKAKEAVARGEPAPALHDAHRKIRCAWPTTPSDRNETYDAMAQAYLGVLKARDLQPTDPKAAHNAVVDGCRACHEVSCTGPLGAIEKLRL